MDAAVQRELEREASPDIDFHLVCRVETPSGGGGGNKKRREKNDICADEEEVNAKNQTKNKRELNRVVHPARAAGLRLINLRFNIFYENRRLIRHGRMSKKEARE